MDQLWEKGTLLENFGEARSHFLTAVPELKDLFSKMASRCREIGSRAVENILSLCGEAGISEEERQELVRPLKEWTKRLEETPFDLSGHRLTIQSLWSGEHDIQSLEERLRRSVEAAIAKQRGESAPGERPKRRLRVREIPEIPSVIRNTDDLSRTLQAIEQAVNTALQGNMEVELG